jgi:hypothetical protein
MGSYSRLRGFEPLELRLLLDGGGFSPDRFEPDDLLSTAANIGVGPGVHLSNLSIDSTTDQDWYQFQLLRSDSLNVSIGFTRSAGNLSLEVRNANNQSIGTLSTPTDQDLVQLSQLAAGTYYVHVSGISQATNSYSLSIDPGSGSTTRVFYVNDTSTTNDYYSEAPGDDANDGLSPTTPMATVANVLANYTIGPTDLILVDTGTYDNGVTIDADHKGAAYAGSPGCCVFDTGGTAFELVDADFDMIYGLTFMNNSNGIYAHSSAVNASTNNVFENNTFLSTGTAIRVDSGQNYTISGNTIAGGGSYGIQLNNPGGQFVVTGNTISGHVYGLLSSGNQAQALTLQVGGSTASAGNTLSGGTYGIYSDSNGIDIENNVVANFSNQGIAVYGSGTVRANTVFLSTTGIFSTSATVSGNVVHDNQTGITGTATLGGTDWTTNVGNEVYNNTTGIVPQGSASVAFNRIHDNTIGISIAGSGQRTVSHNVLYRNSAQAVLVDNSSSISIVSNTVYAPQGDAVRIRNSSSNITLETNIFWVQTGYDIYVSVDSQQGFASDYNNLFASGTGKPVWWQKDFTDLFDWQVEARYDLHSIGYTAINPTLDNPLFVNLGGDDYHLTNVTSTSIDAGDPASAFSMEPGPNGGRIDLGAYGNTAQAAQSAASYVKLDYPNYYSDWEVNVGHAILWHTFNLSGNLSIDVYLQGNNTPLAHIATVDASAGSYGWSPSASGITGTINQRYFIRISSVADTTIKSDSREAFSVPTAGNTYYVNDSSTTGDQYTTAVGNNRNTGKSPGDPKANLLPMLGAYALGPANTVYIDTGSYIHVRNVVISADANVGSGAGTSFIGPTNSGALATINRANTSAGTTVIDLNDGGFTTISNLTLTGAERGLWVRNGSTHFSGSHLTVTGNSSDGLTLESDATGSTLDTITATNNGGNGINVATAIASLNNTTASNNGGTGIALSNPGNVVLENDVASGNQTGISVSNSLSNTTTVIGNSDLTLGKGNLVYNNLGTGIAASGNAIVAGNAVYGNYDGITGTGVVEGNRVFHNSHYGIAVSGASVAGNRVYSNLIGIHANGGGPIDDNLVYANVNQGMLLIGISGLISNNTVYQIVGDAIDVQGSPSATIRNNILWSDAGFDLNVDSSSQTGLNSDYNLFYKGADPNAHVGFWGTPQDTLAAWQSATGKDAHSQFADPKFVDRDGADNILGYSIPQVFDGGPDDNFQLSAGSPAIDAGESWSAPSTDILGASRSNDPGTTVKLGTQDYAESAASGSVFAGPAVGVAQNWRANDTGFSLSLPFSFSFYGTSYSSVIVSTEGYLQFGNSNSTGDSANSVASLAAFARIAPLWDDLRTDGPGDDIFVDTSHANQVTIRWRATNEADNGDVNFAVTLFSSGKIRFDYGAGNANLTSTIGISSGNGVTYALSKYDSRTNLANAPSVLFSLQPGITDLGAFEFRGSSLDTTPPTVLSTSPPGINASATAVPRINQIAATFSEPLDSIDANAPANFELRGAGADGIFDTGDDVLYAVTPGYTTGSTIINLNLGVTLPIGAYRLTVKGSGNSAVHDLSGLALDGDANGTAGGDYVRTFTVTNIQAQTISFPTIVDQTYGASVPLSASASSGLAVTFSVLSGPATIVGGNSLLITGIGTVTVEALQAGNGSVAAATLDRTFDANPAPLTIQADNHLIYFGQPLPTLTLSYLGLVNGDTAASLATPPMVSTTATANSPVGEYSITASGAAGSNYSISYLDGTLTIASVNQAPSFTKGADQTIVETAGPQTVAGWATNISPGPASDSGQTLNFITNVGPVWGAYAGGPQHTADASVATQDLSSIHWQTPVDLAPQYSGDELLIHYGTPLVTASNTIIVPVKTGASGGFELTAVNGANGTSKWTQTTDYVLPPHGWIPSYSPVLTQQGRLYYAGAGGTIYYRDNVDNSSSVTPTQLAFYGLTNYTANASAYNSTVFIDTPITADVTGNIYFGFTVTGSNPSGLTSGFARISASGVGTYISAMTASGDSGLTQTVYNAAPALSNDGSALYVAVSSGDFGRGALLALNSTTLQPLASVALKDPSSGNNALLPNDGTASPMVGPDGDVYFGVLENPFPANHDRGWLLHFSGDLSQTKTPGAFGWDDTPSVVPASMVPSYTGTSSYLLMTKYNNYAGVGGDGVNKLAILDPNASMADPITGATVMQEVLTIAGPTPDSEFISSHPNAVREWCINTAVVDPATDSILANSEDGKLYRWNLSTNTFSQSITLTSGIGEAYTPTFVGADGTVYAINNATLFAVGSTTPRPFNGLFAAQPSIDPATGNLTYQVADHVFGKFTVSVQLHDNGGTGGGGIDTSAPQVFTITATQANQAPTGADNTVTLLEDNAYRFALADFGFSDPYDSPPNNFLTVKIATTTATGALFDNGNFVSPGDFVSVVDIAAGRLLFAPAHDANGSAYANFTFQVQDDGGTAGGTAGGGVDLDPAPKTMTINVTPVNDQPVRIAGNVTDLNLIQYSAITSLGLAGLNYGPGGGADEASQTLTYTITAVPSASLGSIVLSDGTTVVTTNATYSLGQIQGMAFKPNGNAFGGPATFAFKVQDNGGTANGGSDTLGESLMIAVAPIVATRFDVHPLTSTITAGTPFVVMVSALDGPGNVATAYAGTVHLTSSDPNVSFSGDATLTSGVGFFATIFATAGGQTVSATDTVDNTIAGTSGSVLVTPASADHFVVGVPPSTPITGSSVSFTVTAKDRFNNTATNYTGAVTLSSNDPAATYANGSFTAGDNGVHSFTSGVTFNTPGAARTITVAAGSITGTSNSFLALGLAVSSFTPTASGFTATFTKPLNPATLNLFDASTINAGAADVTLVLGASTNIRGSLYVSPDNKSITFVKTNTSATPGTGGILAAGAYSVTFRSANNGFKDALGSLLDGNSDGTTGDNYSMTFTVNSSSAPVLSIPDFARGPQSLSNIKLPNNSGSGIPVTMASASGTTDVTFDVQYNPSILTISGTLTNGAPAGTTFTLVGGAPTLIDSTHAVASFHYANSTPSGATLTLGQIVANVPNSASSLYQAKGLLHLANIVRNTTDNSTRNADSFQVVAYFGDTNGDHRVTAGDASLVNRVVLTLDTGFAAYRLVDPLIVGDINGGGTIDGTDVTLVNRFVANLFATSPQIPQFSTAGLTFTSPGSDPALSIPTNLSVSAGGTVSVPVNIDEAKPAGSTGLSSATLAIRYDPRVFSVSTGDIHLGSVPASGSGWTIHSVVNPLTGEIGIDLWSPTPIATDIGGSLVTIDLHALDSAVAGVTAINLTDRVMPDAVHTFETQLADGLGLLTLHAQPTAGYDPGVDGSIIVHEDSDFTVRGASILAGASVPLIPPPTLASFAPSAAPMPHPLSRSEGIAFAIALLLGNASSAETQFPRSDASDDAKLVNRWGQIAAPATVDEFFSAFAGELDQD